MASFGFPAGSTANLLFQLAHNSPVATQFQVLGDNQVAGAITRAFSNPSGSPNPHPSYTMYFDMVFNRAFASWGTWTAGSSPTSHRATAGSSPAVSDAAGSFVSFGVNTPSPVEAKVGISYVSVANATLNRHAEIRGWNFDAVHTAATAAWNSILGRIRIAGGTPSEQEVFYTNLYDSLLFPSVFSDVNGQYRGWDGRVHTVGPGHASYANFSGWDVYRSDIQLIAMLAPHRMSDMVTSMLEDYTQTGQLPQWSADHMERYIMLGDPADSIIADAYAFGARGFDTATALRDMVSQATVPNVMRPGLQRYEQNGYIPFNGGPYGCCNFRGVVSAQLEYNVADNSIAEMARALGHAQLATQFATRANNWQNSFDPATGFLQPKSVGGVFRSANTTTAPYGAAGFFDPFRVAFFADGTKYVYTPMLPFDVGGVIAASGGNGAWVHYLDALTSNITSMGATSLEMTNEPSTAIPWEYDYAGAPYKTEELVRQIQDRLYTDQPGGLPGNSDQGELTSWYVWSALGLYPETPGSATLVLGSPLFPRIAVHMGDGTTIVEQAPGAAEGVPYVHALSLNGMKWPKTYVPQDMLAPGHSVVLHWTLGSTPDTSWASGPAAAPPSNRLGLAPALGYLGSGSNGGSLYVQPGGHITTNLGVQSMSSAAEEVNWTATVPAGSGLTVSPASGTMTLGSEARISRQITLAATPGAPHGAYPVTIHLRTSAGTGLPDVVAKVGVSAHFDNIGISSDSAQGAADFDGTGYSYSQQALASAGLDPGGGVTSGGVSYVWPKVAAGTPDNIVADGQTISVTAPPGASTLGLLGASSDGNSSGDITITYTDGTTQTATIGFGDWITGAGAYGDATVAVSPYRNFVASTLGSQQIKTHVYAATVPLQAGKTVASVTLPSPAGGSAMHIFTLGTNRGPVTLKG